MYYLLDENKNPYKVSLEEGLKVYEDPVMKIVKQDRLDNDEVFVSTVFLGLDHGWGDKEASNYQPILFETMIFGGEHSDFQTRYHTFVDAVEGHEYAVNLVKESLKKSE
jgi:hypothetical protein